jgi:hypothetical protein
MMTSPTGAETTALASDPDKGSSRYQTERGEKLLRGSGHVDGARSLGASRLSGSLIFEQNAQKKRAYPDRISASPDGTRFAAS